MQNYNSKFKIFENVRSFAIDGKEKATKINSEIYSSGKISDSPGGFGYKRTRKINQRTLSKISQRTY